MPALNWWWNQLCQAVTFTIGHLQNASDVAYRGPRCHSTKGTNIGNPIMPVFISAVFYHFIAACILNINIDIWHTNTVRVKEPFKQQIVLKRVEVGNIECIGND